MKKLIVKVENVYKSFKVGNQNVPVLLDISFNIPRGDFVIINGPSGCGKSTLLHTILGLEPPNKGQVQILGKDLYGPEFSEDYRSEIRKKHIGMIYQQSNWIKAFTVLKNVAFPLSIAGIPEDVRTQEALDLLTKVEMQKWKDYSLSELSSGQQQKVALARALITNPEIIIADEPTGNLDYESGQDLVQILLNLNKKEGKTIIMVTHDLDYIELSKSTIHMLDGEITEIKSKNLKSKGKLGVKK
jgi:putative ABC transport system ATP-binding protein